MLVHSMRYLVAAAVAVPAAVWALKYFRGKSADANKYTPCSGKEKVDAKHVLADILSPEAMADICCNGEASACSCSPAGLDYASECCGAEEGEFVRQKRAAGPEGERTGLPKAVSSGSCNAG